MNPKKYMLHYDWRENRNGQFMFHEHYETDSLVLAIKCGGLLLPRFIYAKTAL